MDSPQFQSNYIKQKKALVRAKKSGSPNTIIDACNAALASFDQHGYPDQWHDWERAKYDAQMELNLKKRAW
ncbi:MAG: hypothetical protein M0R32_05840 [Candidatus Cloacimonetes bacterium]|jgi:hypothetical protein|nr:hypothetical protein [Candidatus Cloacimonadota bacterium]